MYTKDKSYRITLRLNEAQFDHVKRSADVLGVSPSEFLRMVVNATMVAAQSGLDKIQQEGRGRANDKANLNDIV